MKRLFICEKPSLAAAVAENLGGRVTKRDGYYEVGDDRVAWLRGHILEQYMPGDYKPEWGGPWKREVLPMVPDRWEKRVKAGRENDCRPLYKNVEFLLKGADEVVNVGDPDREGQLLVDEVLALAGNRKPVKRLLVNAMDEVTVKRALGDMQDNVKYRNLYDAALGRERLDWLIGMNGSRRYSLDAGEPLAIGRVKSCVLGIVHRRNELIDNFQSTKYYELAMDFTAPGGEKFTARWQPKGDTVTLDAGDNACVKKEVEGIRDAALATDGKILSCEKKDGLAAPPLPYSLSTLQREAGAAYGFSPAKVLELAESLYLKKLTSYPRSDSNYLPESQFSDAGRIAGNLKRCGNGELEALAGGANVSLRSKAWNTGKIEAHHAIIPTMEKADMGKLSEAEKKLYSMIAKRYLLQFYPPQRFKTTTILVDVNGETYKATGKVVTDEGWKKASGEKESSTVLPMLEAGTRVKPVNGKIDEKDTTPPPRFTQDTLIGAMTQAWKYVKDQGLKETVKDIKGIGTEATRATVIEELLNGKSKMLTEEGKGKRKELFLTPAAKELVNCLPAELTYPDRTALMELELDKVAKGELTLDRFMESTVGYVKHLMDAPSSFTPKAQRDTLHAPDCPCCGKGKLIRRSGAYGTFWGCTGYKDKENPCKAVFDDYKGKPVIEKCPCCKEGYMHRHKSKNKENTYYWSCDRLKDGCATFRPDKNGRPVMDPEKEFAKGKGSAAKNTHGKSARPGKGRSAGRTV